MTGPVPFRSGLLRLTEAAPLIVAAETGRICLSFALHKIRPTRAY